MTTQIVSGAVIGYAWNLFGTVGAMKRDGTPPPTEASEAPETGAQEQDRRSWWSRLFEV